MKALFKYSKIKLIISFALFILAIIVLFPLMLKSLKAITETAITPDRSFGYDLSVLSEIKQLYGSEGAKTYFFTRFSYDIIWMLIYLFFFNNLVLFLLDGLTVKWLMMTKALPFIAFASDLFENSLCSLYFFNGQKVVGQLAVVASQMKWYSLLLTFIAVTLLAVSKIYQKIKSF